MKKSAMCDAPTARSKNMAAIKSKDTKPELRVRALVHGLGYRYRVHAAELPGKPDIVNRSKKQAIFVHGCFWHGHARPGCPRRSIPKTNLHYWETKLRRNVLRDQKNLSALLDLGYTVLTVWECETRNADWLRENLCQFCFGKAALTGDA